MLRIGVRFLSGRYHATPTGRHVNEGVIEWPPSPWRVLRALIATGFSKHGWKGIPPLAAEAIEQLAASLPVFHVPPSGSAHTRHYMPMFKGSTTKVIDAFAYPGRDTMLVMEWDAGLGPEQLELVVTLFRTMSYLGRAESWIEVQPIDTIPDGLLRCAPAASADAGDAVELLAPLTPDEYARWREDMLEREHARRLAVKQAAARSRGKKIPTKLSKAEREQLGRELPESLLDALCVESADLQKSGWSQPPGSRQVTYLRPPEALVSTPPRQRQQARRQGPDTALLALVPDTRRARYLPPMHDALARCDMLHQALVRASDKKDGHGPSPCFTGKDSGGPLKGHQHATLIPLSLDARSGGSIDHIAVHARMGFDEQAIMALRRIRKTYAKDHPGLFVTLISLGQRADYAGDVPQLAEAQVWESATPFVPPRFLKPRGANSLRGQIEAELESRGVTARLECVEIEIEGARGAERAYRDVSDFWELWRLRGSGLVTLREPEAIDESATSGADVAPVPVLSRRWRRYRRVRRGSEHREHNHERSADRTKPSREQAEAKQRPPVPAALGLRLQFAGSVAGPLSLGFGSHFGLGSFVPAR